MGIKYFGDVFGNSLLNFTNKDYNGMKLGVDASYEICSAAQATMNVLTSGGENTGIYNVITLRIAKYKKLGIKGLIYIFDNPSQNPMKIEENKKRRDERKKYAQRSQGTKRDKYCFRITSEIVSQVKTLLNFMGVAWIVAPEGYESEHLGAHLTKIKFIDAFFTTDVDALTFGAENVLVRKKVPNEKKYVMKRYNLAKILKDYNLDMDTFIHLCVVLGTDFASKTPRIGSKTILKKGPEQKLTEKQQAAKDYFKSTCPFDTKNIHKEKKDIEGLINWLVTKDFNRKRLEKALVNF